MSAPEEIQQWQASIQDGPTTEDSPMVAFLFRVCSQLFCTLVSLLQQQISTHQPAVQSLHQSCCFLLLWADGHHVQSGRLDASLERSRRARDLTLRLLESICHALTQPPGLLHHVNTENETHIPHLVAQVEQSAEKLRYLRQKDCSHGPASDTSSDDSWEGDTLQEIAEDLETDTQCLLKLGPRFEEPQVGPVTEEQVAKPRVPDTRSWDPVRSFTDRIMWRYPKCDVDVAERLGNANWYRLQRYQATKEENARLQEQNTTVGMVQEAGNQQSRSGKSTDGERTRDSGLGTSMPSSLMQIMGTGSLAPSTYADTIMSYRGGERGDSVRVPPLPEGAKRGEMFSCVGCGKMIQITKSSEWKKHLFLDLQPYMCLEVHCAQTTTSPFATKDQWIKHLQNEHNFWDSSNEDIVCSLCNETIRDGGKMAVLRHFSTHLEEISLAVLPTVLESEYGTDSESDDKSTKSEEMVSTHSAQHPEGKKAVNPITNADDDANNPLNSSFLQDAVIIDADTPLYNPNTDSKGRTDELTDGDPILEVTDSDLSHALTTEPQVGDPMVKSDRGESPDETTDSSHEEKGIVAGDHQKGILEKLDDAWNEQKPRLKQLYVKEGKSLKEVRDIMATNYGWHVSPLHYDFRLFSVWGWEKREEPSDAGDGDEGQPSGSTAQDQNTGGPPARGFSVDEYIIACNECRQRGIFCNMSLSRCEACEEADIPCLVYDRDSMKNVSRIDFVEGRPTDVYGAAVDKVANDLACDYEGCGMMFRKQVTRIMHAVTVHAGNKPGVCGVCGKLLRDAIEMGLHTKGHQEGEIPKGEEQAPGK